MSTSPPTLGTAAFLAAGRTRALDGWGWRTALNGAFERERFVVEMELSADSGLLTVVGVPPDVYEEALRIVWPEVNWGAPTTPQSAGCRVLLTALLEGAALAQARAALESALGVVEPSEQWGGRDGCWAETELWLDGQIASTIGTRFPAGEVEVVDAAQRALLACWPDEDAGAEIEGIRERWLRWLSPRPPPTRNQLKHRRC